MLRARAFGGRERRSRPRAIPRPEGNGNGRAHRPARASDSRRRGKCAETTSWWPRKTSAVDDDSVDHGGRPADRGHVADARGVVEGGLRELERPGRREIETGAAAG